MIDFWSGIFVGFVLGVFSCIWILGYFIFKDDIRDYLIKKIFRIRNWFNLKSLKVRIKYLRWRRV